MLRHLSFVAFAVVVSGCATRPVSNSEAISVPASQILNSEYLRPADNTSQVTVKRDSGFFGAACSTRIFIDAKPVADLFASEKVVLHLVAGDYVLSAWPNSICGGGMSEVRTTIKPGIPQMFRFGMGSNGDSGIYPTAF